MLRQSLRTFMILVFALTALGIQNSPNRLAEGMQSPARLPEMLELQLGKIEEEARKSGILQAPSPRLLVEIERLTDSLLRTPETRSAQLRGRRIAQEALESRSLEVAARVEKTLSALQDEIDHDITYTKALQTLDARLYPLQSKAFENRADRYAPRLSNPSGLPFDRMRPGDIMLWNDRSGRPLIRFAVSLFAKDYTHSAMYLGDLTGRKPDGRRHVYESMNLLDGTKIDVMDKKWKRHGLGVALGHVRGVTPAQAKRLALGAIRAFGDKGKTPYHAFPPWDKTYFNEGVYCSQLTWEPYSRVGIDLDSNDWRYLVWFAAHNWQIPFAASTAFFGVFPDEIKSSPHIDWYYDRLNR